MKKSIFISSILLLAGIVYCYTHWKIQDAESKIKFSIKNLSRTVDGTIGGMKAEISFDEANASKGILKGTIDVKTINTGNKKRDNHLRSADYFDAEKFPLISFTSHSISKAANGFVAHGKLTIKDVSKDINIPFTFDNKGTAGVFKGILTIDRTEFHVGEKSKIMGELVTVEVTATVAK